ncbi:unnamed protein product [Thelazia callipaeda]|uniref:Glutathione peroxidase n=1 Tax=Thelazia callipaeda TaxID=103827 RepID=A0A0N5CVU0_THECL|nr:unnamed protein product [Thelazia callipaeda]
MFILTLCAVLIQHITAECDFKFKCFVNLKKNFVVTERNLLNISRINVLLTGPRSSVSKPKLLTKCKISNRAIYDFQVENLDGSMTDLSSYRNKVILLINVATYCSFTEQYKDFNLLLNKNSNASLVILAFPCNQFHYQEPARNHELLNGLKYVRPGEGWQPHEKLHIFGKLNVNGDSSNPLYKFLKEVCPQTAETIGRRDELMYDPISVNDITWNFEKFLIDKKGRPRYRFHPTAWGKGTEVQPFIYQLENE